MVGIDKNIFSIISNHKKIKPHYKNDQVIRQSISNIKRKNAALTSNAATQVFAQKHGVSVFRYLDDKDKKGLSKYTVPISENSGNSKGRNKKNNTKQIINIITVGDIEDPIISVKLAKEAKKMAEVYPILYVFENSVRIIIQKILDAKYGRDWWKKATIPTKIIKKVEGRKKSEDNNKWHGARGAHEINYTDIEELVNIIESNWEIFEPHLPKQHIVKAIIEIIGTSRNVIAHHNPLDNDDILSVKLNYRKWVKQVKDIEFS